MTVEPEIWIAVPQDRPDSANLYAIVSEHAGRYIPDYLADNGKAVEALEQPTLTKLFTMIGEEPPKHEAYALVDPESTELLAGAIVEPLFYADEVTTNPEGVREVARHHATLAGMFTQPQFRGRGLGKQLLRGVCANLIRRGVRYLDGFSDERGDSAGFYAAAGAVVMERNEGLPEREPTHFATQHPAHLGLNGHWFYFDIAHELVREQSLFCDVCRENHRLTVDQPGAALACACTA